MMHGTIQRWGNSHGIRIPKGVLHTVRLKENDDVEIIVDAERIIIRKAQERDSLDVLFAEYSGNYHPSEMDYGEPVGREVYE